MSEKKRSYLDELPEWMTNPTRAPSDAPSIAQKMAAEGHVSGYDKLHGIPFIARAWSRRLRPDWPCDDPGTNLLDDIADMRARPEFLTEQDQKSLRHVERAAIRSQADGSKSVHLSDIHFWKLTGLVRRFTHPHLAASFLRKQARDARATPEAKAARRKKRQSAERPQEQRSEQEPQHEGRYVQWTTPTFYNRGFAND